MKEESRFYYLTNLVAVLKIRLDRAEQEKNWLAGNGRLTRDFASYKDLFSVRLWYLI
jgi:hypothetical protein